MKKAKYFALVLSVIPFTVFAGKPTTTTNQEIYSESVTRQLSAAEVPKSFESNSRQAAGDGEATVADVIEQAEGSNSEATAVVKQAGKKAAKKHKLKASN